MNFKFLSGKLATCALTMFCSLMPFVSYSELPSPYSDLQEVLPFNNHGWYENGPFLEKLIQDLDAKTVVEVGSWLGLSTRHLASLLKQPGSKLYAVDHWFGSEEHQVGQWAYHPSLGRLYEQFLSNIIHANLTDIVVPVRMPSQSAAKILSVVPDLIYIDGAHDYNSVLNDLSAWYPFVKGHGVLCGDDWGWETVRNAVLDFAKMNSLTVFAERNFWRLVE